MEMNMKITSVKDLERRREAASRSRSTDEQVIHLCAGAGCIASGAMEVKEALEQEIEKAGLTTQVKETGCLGPCAQGPVLLIKPDDTFYEGVQPEDAGRIVAEHLQQQQVVRELTHRNHGDGQQVDTVDQVDFYQGQAKIVLRNCGSIDPLNLDDFIAAGGYSALAKAIEQYSPEQVIEEIKHSGLRGRGGAGFPTYLKWEFTRKAEGEEKFVLCNADEGDPGAFMDRSVLEGDPHSLVEGMAIAAYAVGADRGFVYVRAEYPLAVERFGKALKQAREAGLLGENIMGSDFSFDLEIRMGSGAFVCGEETALIHSIESKRGEPRPRPPFPAQKGLWDKPSLLNNVETYTNVGAIIDKGSQWYASHGSEHSKGTKVFALAGAINASGLVEVPIGTSLGELIYDVGGGIPNGKPFKAAQIGGPSGGCIPKEYLNVPLDYHTLSDLGAIMGSGGLIVMDDDTCMVDVARYFLEFVQEESCGKCTPCRVGTKRMLEILTRITEGEGEEGDIETLEKLGRQIQQTALCGLGQTAPNPVLSTIRHFRYEYEQHIRDKHCEAGICAGLVRAPCQSACPAGVDVPGFVSLVGEKRYAEALRLHRERNPFAAVCARVCFHTCEERCRRSSIDDPVAVRGIKRFMADQEVTLQIPEVRESEENAKRNIAIIGAGPAGLSCAYFLARLGYRPTVFEAEPRPGGMMAQTIPAYRLPRETLAREIRMIENMGVNIVTDSKLGRDFSLNDLRDKGYEAVFLGIGAPQNMELGVEGEDAEGVVQAIDFLKQYNIRGSVPVGRNIVVVGGGNAAIDAARTAMRLGAKEVTILYRRTREQMPAYAEEIEEALREGIKLRTLTQPIAVKTNSEGRVSGMECACMQLGEFDRSGRRRPTKSGQGNFTMVADQVIVAIGQKVDTSPFSGDLDIHLGDNRFVDTHPVTGQSSVDWLFAGGDVATGPVSVVAAIGSGERAAVGIDEYLTGEQHAFWREEVEVDTAYDPDAEPAPYHREPIPTIEPDRRRNNFEEVERTWPESVALRQCARCLRCDYGKTQAK